jgi:hypothetical protein
MDPVSRDPAAETAGGTLPLLPQQLTPAGTAHSAVTLSRHVADGVPTGISRVEVLSASGG